ncbi:MAG: tetratricopeptide repeat protein, partial [Candidatus Binataceae bacterium]
MNRTFNYALAALIVCLATATGCEQIRELRGMPVQTVSNAGANPFGGAPAVEIPPDAKAMGAFLVAEYASDEGDHEAALKGYEDAVAADPTNSTLRVRLATLYVRDGRLKEALTQVNEALKNNPDSVDARLLAAGISGALGDDATAEADYKQVLQESPQNQEAYLYLGT